MPLQARMAVFRRVQEDLEAVRARPHTRQEVIWEMRDLGGDLSGDLPMARTAACVLMGYATAPDAEVASCARQILAEYLAHGRVVECDDAECILALEVPLDESSDIFEQVRSIGALWTRFEMCGDYARITLET